MRRPNLKMIEPGRGHGAGSGEVVLEEIDKANATPQGASDTVQRRADSIRKLAIG